MANWRVQAKRADFTALAAKYNVDQVTARLMVNRGVTEEEMEGYLHPDLSQLHDPMLLLDLDRACDILEGKIREGKKIRVIGDYDVDGIFSTYILVHGLKGLGADCDHAIPHRVHDGYGVNPNMVSEAAEDGVETILTCDNGIAAIPAIELAKELNMTVVVTDHHAIPFSTVEEDGEEKRVYHLPPADVVVDPHRVEDTYPFPQICGAVVAWKLITALFARAGKEKEAMYYLPMAAFATVCDIMPLQGENRTMVALGLPALEKTANKGLQALMTRAGIEKGRLNSYHIGFVLGPAFNATGRLDTAEIGLSLLMEEDEGKAAALASQLISLNEQRKTLTEEGTSRAMEMVAAEHMENDRVLVIYLPDLHESLCGIIAGRIKERYYRPTFVLCDGEEGVKGSGRSIESYSMYERMQQANQFCLQERGEGIFTKFGGHPMAAGLSMKREDVDRLRELLEQQCELAAKDLEPKILIDVPMPLGYLSPGRIQELSVLEPFGNGNPKPVFADKNLQVMGIRAIGKQSQYRKLSLAFGGDLSQRIDGLYFGEGEALDEDIRREYGQDVLEAAYAGRSNPIRLSVTYYPGINEYRGQVSMQVIIGEYMIQ
ncbi:MAG: single-stranded-DNA-specific exonuclease RecJ [Lachnospiraceae bacterium]|nr:single-stranded-DNA-specific exonuclease RecJ [Lachnospiraceae bacterium]